MTRTTTLLALSLTLTAPAAVLAQDAPKKTTKQDLPQKKAPAKRETLDQRIERLVRQLGDRKYDVRETAFDELLKVGRPALAALKQAAKSPDPEVASAAAEAVELIEKGKTSPRSAGPGESTPRRAPGQPGFRGRRQPVPLPSREELFKELQKALPRDFGKAFQRFFKDAQPNGGDRERSGRLQPRVRVWTWTNAPRRPQLDGVAGQLGFKVGPTSGVVRAQLSIRKGEGLVVNQLVKDGFGAAHGLKLYDVLLTHDGRPLRTRKDLLTLAEKGGKLELYRKAKLVTLELPAAPKATTKPAGAPKPSAKPKKASKSSERDF